MIVHESDALTAALDRRLQVDRLLALDPLAAIGRPQDRSGAASSARPNGAAAPDAGPTPTAIAGRLPLGRVIDARVVDVPHADHVVAEFETLRIDLAWSAANGATPRPGSDVALRVLAHVPMLLFQAVPAEAARSSSIDGAMQWSDAAVGLQPHGAPIDPSSGRAGTVRFDVPILRFVAAPHDDAAVAPRSVDDVVVAGGTSIVDALSTGPIDAPDIPDRPPATAFAPLVLQGPAWPEQPMELVVRRERADEQFDNPALDHWCGEVTIDLPHLGRVAAHLAFSLQGLRIRVDGDDAAGVDAMTAAAPALATALASADLRVSALTICRPAADSVRPDATIDPVPSTAGRTLEWTDRG